MDWVSTIMSLMSLAPQVKKWIDIGLPIAAELQKSNPRVVPILEQIGVSLFPNLAGTVHQVAAAADAIFDPHGTMWLQTSLNTLNQAGLDVDGSYGKLTKAAVEKFQSLHQPLAGPIDGWAGPKTEAVLLAELSKLLPPG